MIEFDLIIGLEVHVQLNTKSKMFCSCSASYFGKEPNTHTCPVCLGLPGALPVANREAIKKALTTGIALSCSQPEISKFDRKNYFYPDLAKGFQISQFDQPFSVNGHLLVGDRKIRINRAHLEEDTGKLIHADVDGSRVSLVDFNRSGVPLLEIVSEPDITSPEEAREYAQKLNLILRTIGVAEGDMEKAGMRFDANLSLKPKGQKELGTKVEIKNINSFRFLEKAIYYEFSRQSELLQKGEKIVQETRGWVESKGVTQTQRSKEQAHDYRYFPEPDIPTFIMDNEHKKDYGIVLLKLPDARVADIVRLGLEERFAKTLVDKDSDSWFMTLLHAYEQTESKALGSSHFDNSKAQILARWMMEVFRILKEKNLLLAELKGEASGVANIQYRIDKGELTAANAKQVLEEYLLTGDSIDSLIKKYGIGAPKDLNLDEIVSQVIQVNQKAVNDYQSGKDQALFFLVGQVVKESRGAANAEDAKRTLLEKLKDAH